MVGWDLYKTPMEVGGRLLVVSAYCTVLYLMFASRLFGSVQSGGGGGGRFSSEHGDDVHPLLTLLLPLPRIDQPIHARR